MLKEIKPTDHISFRGHDYICAGGAVGFQQSHAFTPVELLTMEEYAALDREKGEHKGFRRIEHRDLQLIENKFGKEDEALGARQGQAIIDFLGLPTNNDIAFLQMPTGPERKRPIGILLTVENVIGRFDAFDTDGNDEIDEKRGKIVANMARLTPNSDGFYETPRGPKRAIGLICALRDVVRNTK